MTEIRVISPGFLTTCQDLGRHGDEIDLYAPADPGDLANGDIP